jgi:hypothetical protein
MSAAVILRTLRRAHEHEGGPLPVNLNVAGLKARPRARGGTDVYPAAMDRRNGAPTSTRGDRWFGFGPFRPARRAHEHEGGPKLPFTRALNAAARPSVACTVRYVSGAGSPKLSGPYIVTVQP